MRHHNANRKFGREKAQRVALLKSLARALILHGKIETTETKARELRPFVEKLVSKSRNDSVSTRRLVISRLGSVSLAKKLATDIGPRYKTRNGGYTRIVKLSKKNQDGSRSAVIEFV